MLEKRRIIRRINWKRHIKGNPEQVQDEDFSFKKKKRIAQILERGQSLLQYRNVVQFARLVFYEAVDPTPLQDEG